MRGDIPGPRPASEDWRGLHAFGLPAGSIRAALALAIFATTWALLLRKAEVQVPDYLRDLLLIILGHYFAARNRPEPIDAAGPAPLFLPRGTIRVVLVGGCVGVAVLLARQGRLGDVERNPGVVSLLLVGGFLLGVVSRTVMRWVFGEGGHPPRWLEDARAAAALLAAAALVALVWDRYFPYLPASVRGPHAGFRLKLGEYGPEHALGAVVGFYFGSRS